MAPGKIDEQPRVAGVCLHLASLPGRYGIGEIGRNAKDFIDRMRDMELSVWQFLPTGPTAYGDSPYQPLSTFAGNELLIDIAELVKQGLLTETEVAGLTALPHDFTDYGALIPVKTHLLRLAAMRLADSADPGMEAALGAFVAEHDGRWLHDYALFRVLKTQYDEKPWTDWPSEFAGRDKDAIAEFEAAQAERITTVKIIQFLFHRQWRALRDYAGGRGIRLFGDMPIYIALDSADAWANRNMLRLDANGRPGHVAGVPPDYFSEDGQLWGNPLYDWDRHRETGFRWWIDRLRASTELADLVRIDHFRGFEAYWSVPAGAETAKTGSWEPGPGDAIFDALRDALGDLPVVAENLGVITPEVEALRERQSLPGMRVLQFDVTDPDFVLSDVAADSICYTGTHDNDTTVGWFRGSPDDIRTADEIRSAQEAALRVTGGTPGTIHADMIRAAFSTRAEIAIAPMQDLLGLGSEARINTPGTSGNNWRWRVRDTQITDRLCDNIAEMVKAAGRAATA
jgi:4-alpha-glucanotransferase